MATFDLNAFVANPSIEALNNCRKDDLIKLADHYRITVKVGDVKAKVRDVVYVRLVEMGVLVPLVAPRIGVLSGVAASANVMLSADESKVDGLAAGFGGTTDGAIRGSEMDGSGLGEDVGTATVAGLPVVRPVKFPDPSRPRLGSESHSDSAGSGKSTVSPKIAVRIARMKREERERQRDKEFQLQVELSKINADKEIRIRQMELEMAEKARSTTASAGQQAPCHLQSGSSLTDASGTSRFDIARHIGLVPPFREAEVDSYFNAFERVATALAWPKDVWSILLQCKLVGKAQEVLATLSIKDSMNYDIVKSAILRIYERVPESYRQRFRQHVKSSSQTFVEFAREKEALFDRWCAASKVNDFQSLRALLLVEEFKRGLPDSICMHLNEQRVTSLSDAAIFADEFVLTHKSVFRAVESSSSKSRKSGDAQARHSPERGGVRQREERACHYCKKVGHLIATCRLKQQRQEQNGTKSVGLIRTGESVVNAFVGARSGQDASFDPFVFDGEEMGCFNVAVRNELPIDGISFVMGNDIAGGKVCPVLSVVERPVLECVERKNDSLYMQCPDVSPACVITPAQSRNMRALASDKLVPVAPNALTQCTGVNVKGGEVIGSGENQLTFPVTKESLIKGQSEDPTLEKCCAVVLSPEEDKPSTGYFWEDGLPLSIPFVLLAARDAAQESLGFSPKELVFGHTVRGPLKVLKDEFLAADVSPSTNVVEFGSKLNGGLTVGLTVAKPHSFSAERDGPDDSEDQLAAEDDGLVLRASSAPTARLCNSEMPVKLPDVFSHLCADPQIQISKRGWG